MPVLMPIMMHTLTEDGLDSIEEGLDIINIFIYYGFDKGDVIPPEMWRLLPQIMYITGGADDDVDGGFGFEFLMTASTAIQNYVAKDLTTIFEKHDEQHDTFLNLIIKFIQRILVQNQQSKHKQDGVTICRVLIALLENHPGRLDEQLENLVGILLAEIKIATDGDQKEQAKTPSNYTSMLFQSIATAFYNNASITFQVIEKNNMTTTVFSKWLEFMPLFKQEFEIRRVLFGLASMLKCTKDAMPEIVQQRLPFIVSHIETLTTQVY